MPRHYKSNGFRVLALAFSRFSPCGGGAAAASRWWGARRLELSSSQHDHPFFRSPPVVPSAWSSRVTSPAPPTSSPTSHNVPLALHPRTSRFPEIRDMLILFQSVGRLTLARTTEARFPREDTPHTPERPGPQLPRPVPTPRRLLIQSSRHTPCAAHEVPSPISTAALQPPAASLCRRSLTRPRSTWTTLS